MTNNQISITKPASSSLFVYFFLAAVLVFLRLPALLNPVLDADEAIFALIARLIFDGGVPYESFAETKPPGIYLFYGTVFSVFGKFNMVAVHAVTTVVVGITAYIVGRIAFILYSSQRAAFWAALFYIVFGTTYIPKYIATNIEPVMLLPIALQFYFWVRFEKEGRNWLAFASGVSFSAACLFKYQAGINLFVLILYLIIKWFYLRTTHDARRTTAFHGFCLFLLGAIPLPALMFLYLALVGGLHGFWFWNVRGNMEYIKGGSEHISFLHQVITRVLPYIASTALVWIFAFKKLSCVVRRASCVMGDESKTSTQEWLIILWLLLSFIPVCMGKRFYGHYFLILLPPLSILASSVAADIMQTQKRRFAKAMIIFWIVLPALGFFAARFFVPEICQATGEDNLDDYKPIAAYIGKNTRESDRIAVWGFAPLVYWYSERSPATRFIHTDALAGRISGAKGSARIDGQRYIVPGTWEMFFGDLEKNRPVYFVDTSPAALHDYENYPIEFYPQLVDHLGKYYREEAKVKGGVIYRRLE